jgi:2Fe-2S ferredoxin
MPARNPLLDDADIALPERPYRMTFLPLGRTVQVDPAELPYGDHGLAGSVLDVALHYGIDIEHACGGVCACATCHVIIKEGLESCNEAIDAEEDQLDNAYGVRSNSRLACVCVPSGVSDVVVEIPDWNRNLAREKPD